MDEERSVALQLGTSGRVIVIPEAHLERARHLARTALLEPFSTRAWSELFFFVVSGAFAAVALAFITLTMLGGAALAVTFVGVVVIAGTVRGSRGIGSVQRALANRLLGEQIEDPEPFVAHRGFLGWLQSALRDRAGWRAMAYSLVKVPLTVAGVWFALSVWYDAFFCLTYPVLGRGGPQPPEFGVVPNLFRPGFFWVGSSGFVHAAFIFCTGVVLLLLAPWPMRATVYVDRLLLRSLLGPDAMAARVRSLERARTQTVDASVETLRRIERDLHDGTQAQLVALAMRLGQAKEKLASDDEADRDQARRLVDEAHQGAKEAIVELRDLARGIHPPVLDVGLEGALTTLAARSPVPTTLTVLLNDRPTPAIEAIAYFCVAELLANVAQHARASQASVSCARYGEWLRLVVRDDGIGGARPSPVGSSSSGLSGLGERVRAVDGHIDITSPAGGPTVVTVDLPLHA